MPLSANHLDTLDASKIDGDGDTPTVSYDEIESHPAAAVFPELEGCEFQQLVDDISAHGLIEPIVLCDGKILDGRNRLRACIEASIEPIFTHYRGDSPTGYVISKNIRRRHLTADQRAAFAAELLPVFQADAKKRQGVGGGRGKKKLVSQNGTQVSKVRATAEAGKAAGVSRAKIEQAATVKREDPELLEKVKSGTSKLPASRKSAKPRSRGSGFESWAETLLDGLKQTYKAVEALETHGAELTLDIGDRRERFDAYAPHVFKFLEEQLVAQQGGQ